MIIIIGYLELKGTKFLFSSYSTLVWGNYLYFIQIFTNDNTNSFLGIPLNRLSDNRDSPDRGFSGHVSSSVLAAFSAFGLSTYSFQMTEHTGQKTQNMDTFHAVLSFRKVFQGSIQQNLNVNSAEILQIYSFIRYQSKGTFLKVRH